MRMSQGSPKTRSGNWLDSTGLYDCAVLDERASSWLSEAQEALAEDNLLRAFAPARLYLSYDEHTGRPLLNQLEEKLRSKSQSELDAQNWKQAAEFASMALILEPEDAEMTALKETANQKIEEEAEAARVAAAKLRARRIEESRTRTKSLGQVQVARKKMFNKPTPGPTVEITDVGIYGATRDAYRRIKATGNPEHFAWFCDFSAENPVSSLGRPRLGAYSVRLAGRGDWAFLSEEEREKFISLVTEAIGEWNQSYGDVRDKYKCRQERQE